MTALGERLDAVRARIADACARSRTRGETVTLVAVSKTHPASAVLRAVEHGQRVFGENRVQEALAKQDEITLDVEWHLIGRLQSNKVRQVVGRFALIHGVDRPSLGREIAGRAASAGVVQPVLVQVNVADEPTKGGVAVEESLPLLAELAGKPALEVRGLMAIPPPVERPEDNRRWFARLRKLRDRGRSETGLPLPELSMGMSGDFEVAIEEGATLVRVGQAIFGQRS